MPTITQQLLTAEEFSRLPNPIDGSQQELVRGEIITMPPPSLMHGRVQQIIGLRLGMYLLQNPIGQVTQNSGIITDTGPDSVRAPDISYWSFERMPSDAEPVVYAFIAPELCVEVLSPANRPRRMQEKIREYFASGVRLVWVVDPDARAVTVYHKPGAGEILWEDETLTGEQIIPGFSCKVADFFPPAPPVIPPPSNPPTSQV